MQWQDAAKTIAPYAPAIAGLIGGPTAGGITEGAIKMLSELLGIEPTPAQFIAASQDPAKRDEMVRIELDHQARLEELRINAQRADAEEQTKRLAEINRTFRAEIQRDSVVTSWRSVLGWVFLVSCAGVMSSLVWAMFQPDSDKDALLGNALVMFGIMATVLGIDISRVGKERLASMGQAPNSFMDAVKTRVAGKK